MATGRASGPRHAWYDSITSKLIVIYVLTAACLLTVFTVFISTAFVNVLTRESEKDLYDKLGLLRVILRERPEVERSLTEEIELNWSAFRRMQSYARVLDETGAVLIETPRPNGIAWPAPPASPEASLTRPARVSEWASPAGRHYMIATVAYEFGHHVRARRVLQVALDVTEKRAVIAGYHRMALIMLVFGIGVAIVIAVTVVRRGMRPLREGTAAAQRISASQLHERIRAEDVPAELSALADAFNGMLARLEDSFTRLSQFSADLAHELRTPLSNMMGEAGVALSRSRTAEEYRAVLESALEEYGRLARMIDSLLFLARAENPETRIEKTAFDAREAAQDVLDFYDAVAEEQGVALSCEGEGALSADPVLFRRALSNLVGNAMRYTPRGGSIVLAVAPADGAVEIRVSDTGSGIDAEHLPRIFDRFYMADKSRTRATQGTGLGLAIVKSIMDLHGGTVTVRSIAGEGTTVTLRFPA